MKPIDADKVVFNYGGLATISPTDFVGIAKYFHDQLKTAPELGHDDVVPHGYFEKMGDGSLWCSRCHYGFTRLYPNKYCPNCGAKMDLEPASIFWCKHQGKDKEGIFCDAHIAEGRAFNCPYKTPEDRLEAEYPCSDYEKVEEP